MTPSKNIFFSLKHKFFCENPSFVKFFFVGHRSVRHVGEGSFFGGTETDRVGPNETKVGPSHSRFSVRGLCFDRFTESVLDSELRTVEELVRI